MHANDIPITIKGATETQIVISYTATTTAACTISAVDENSGPAVADLDPTKFPRANSDLDRAAVNGFRWPTVVDGFDRTVFIGGHDEIKLASDGKWYSTALQVNSYHNITVSCNNGADTGNIRVQTANLPVGSYYPELKIPTPGSPMSGMPQFTVDWTLEGRKQKYIDPITGVLLVRVTGPTDNFDDSNPSGVTFFNRIIDPNNAWTNSSNIVANASPPAMLATTNMANAPLLIPFQNLGPSYIPSFDDLADIQVSLYGSSPNGAQAELCITEDGQTCASGVIDQAFTSASGAQGAIPAGFPTPFFSGWGGGFIHSPYLWYDLTNFNYPGMTCSGGKCSISSSVTPGFNLDRKPGSPFYAYNCSAGGPSVLHVAHVDTQYSLTTQETSLSLSGCTYQDMAAGLRVVMKTASTTLNIALTASIGLARGGAAGTNGSKWVCARQKVNDIATDCDGNTQSPPVSGTLCSLISGVYLIQDNGRACLQMTGYGSAGHVAYYPDPYGSGSPWVDNKTLIGYDGTNVWKVQKTGTDYTEYNGGFPHTRKDNWSYTNLTSSTPPIKAQILNKLPQTAVAKALASGLWDTSGPSFENVLATPGVGSGAALQYRWTARGGLSDGLCMAAWADASTNNLISVWASWDSDVTKGGSSAACHFTPADAGANAYVAYQGNGDGSAAPRKFNTSTLLGGPFVSRGTGLHRPDGTFAAWTLSIQTCSNASPTVCTVNANDLDPASFTLLDPSESVQAVISGGGGAWTALNGTRYLHRVDNNTFSVYMDARANSPFDATSLGAFSGPLSVSMMPPVYALVITGVADNCASSATTVNLAATSCGNARVTANLADPHFLRFFPSGNSPMRDGDPISFTKLGNATGYFAKVSCAGCAANQFDVYADSGLTTPVPYAMLSALAGDPGLAIYAETCPDPATVDASWFFADSGIGSAGAPAARCITVRLNTEPCSDFASAGEQAAYPCPSDPRNSSRSSLHNINIGDGFFDLSHVGNNFEYLSVIKKVKTSENQIDVTLVRNYGNLPGGICHIYDDCTANARYGDQHSPGWTLWQTSSIPIGFVPITASSTPATIPASAGLGHEDVGLGLTPGNLSTSGSYLPGSGDPVVNVPAAALLQNPPTFTTNNFPVWAGDNTDPLSILGQSYATLRQIPGVAPDSELSWSGNWASMNIGFGTGPNSQDGGWCSRTMTLQSGTANVYKITPCGNPVIKLYPILAYNGEHGYFVDKSSAATGNQITDDDLGSFCYALNPNECRNGSAAGDIYFSLRGFYDAGQCTSNSGTLGTPCAIVPPAFGGWAIQQRIQPPVYDGNGVRRLTMGVSTIPTQHYAYRYWTQTPDARWGLFLDNPVGGHPSFGSATEMNWWAMKLPPWPVDSNATRTSRASNVNRSKYVPVLQRVTGDSGDQIRIAFGYAENGDPATNLYCMTRKETCWTSSAATPSNPFLFDGEAQHKAACEKGCYVSIPAIAGRVVFYRIERTKGASTTLGPLQAAAVP